MMTMMMNGPGGQVIQEDECHETPTRPPRADGTPPLCPNGACLRRMEFAPDARCDQGAALRPVYCPHCGNRGVVAESAVLVLFGLRHEFLIGYGPSLSTMTIKLSEAALTLFGEHGLTPDRIAAYAAEWALLSGCKTGIVRLSGNQSALTDCYGHFRRSVLSSPSVQAA